MISLHLSKLTSGVWRKSRELRRKADQMGHRMSVNIRWLIVWMETRGHSMIRYDDNELTRTFNVYTRKNAQVVPNLQQTCSNAIPTTCQQDVFVLLVPSLLTSWQRLVDNLLQGCWAQQTCYKLFPQLVVVLQFNNLSTSCEWQPCTTW
jgi:hypothetical protein